MRAGDALRFSGIADIHVWMIVSDPQRDPARVLMVSFTTWQPHLDQACIVEVGEHPFITGRTVINFSRARLTTNDVLDQLAAAGRFQPLAPLSPALLRKIRNAAMDLSTLPLELADVLLDQDLVD